MILLNEITYLANVCALAPQANSTHQFSIQTSIRPVRCAYPSWMPTRTGVPPSLSSNFCLASKSCLMIQILMTQRRSMPIKHIDKIANLTMIVSANKLDRWPRQMREHAFNPSFLQFFNAGLCRRIPWFCQETTAAFKISEPSVWLDHCKSCTLSGMLAGMLAGPLQVCRHCMPVCLGK